MTEHFDASQAGTRPRLPAKATITRVDTAVSQGEKLADITDDARTAADMKESRDRLRRLSAKLVAAREKERLHIARELHEGLAQQLAAMQMELSTLIPTLPADGAKRVDTVLGIALQALSSVRRIASELHPLILEELGLPAALESLVGDSRRLLGIGIHLTMHGLEGILADGAAISVYRMVQEALTNVSRHAKATRVRVDVHLDKRQLVLVVQDNGTGFATPSIHRPGVHGLLGIEERAGMFGGRLHIDAAPGGGSRITVTLPRDAIAGPAQARGAEAATP